MCHIYRTISHVCHNNRMSSWQFRSMRLAVIRVHLFLLAVERIIFVCDILRQ